MGDRSKSLRVTADPLCRLVSYPLSAGRARAAWAGGSSAAGVWTVSSHANAAMAASSAAAYLPEDRRVVFGDMFVRAPAALFTPIRHLPLVKPDRR